MIKETWKRIKNFSQYEISAIGQVRSFHMGYLHLLKPYGKKYLLVRLSNLNAKTFDKLVHILVLEAFVGPRPTGLEANHKDGNKLNNKLENLEWISRSENAKHAFDLGLRSNLGEDAPNARLKNGEVWLIKRLLWFETLRNHVAKMFKISKNTIAAIDDGRIWTHIKFEPTDKDRELYRKQNA